MLVAGGLALGGTITYLALRSGESRAVPPDAALVVKLVDPPDAAPPDPLPLPPPPEYVARSREAAPAPSPSGNTVPTSAPPDIRPEQPSAPPTIAAAKRSSGLR